MNKSVLILAIIALLLSSITLTGCSREPKKNPDAVVEHDAAAGYADAVGLYRARCIMCHGGNLQGRMGDRTNLTNVGDRLSEDEIKSKIINGGNGMPDFKETLTEEHIDVLVEWLSTKRTQ